MIGSHYATHVCVCVPLQETLLNEAANLLREAGIESKRRTMVVVKPTNEHWALVVIDPVAQIGRAHV